MANNIIQHKRTSTAGRIPNTTNSSNTQYIAAGEFALNMPDQILYTSDGTSLIYVGSNVLNQSVTNTIYIGNSSVNSVVNSTIFAAANTTTNFVALSANALIGGQNLGPTITLGWPGNNGPGGNTWFGVVNNPTYASAANLFFANSSVLQIGNNSAYVTMNGTTFSGSSNNSSYLGGTAASSYQLNSTLAANVAILTANNANNLGGVAASSYVNTSGSYTLSGVITHNNNLILNNNKSLNFQTVNTFAYSSFIQQNDDNFVMYSTNATYGQRAIWTVFANSSTSSFKAVVPFEVTSTLVAGSSNGNAGQVLTSNGASPPYWSTIAAATGTNTAAAFTWTNNHTFNANVSINGGLFGLNSNTSAIYFNGITDANWRMGRNTGVTTKFYYTNNTVDIIAAASNLEGFVIGQGSGNTYLETGYAGTFTKNPIYVGNSTVNASINSTTFSGTANNSAYLGGIAAASYTTAFQLTNNLANYAALSGAVFTGAITVPSVNHGNNSVNVNINSTSIAINGSVGTTNQVLTSNGTATIWQTITNIANADAQYTWSNTQTFTNTIIFNSTINGTANNALNANNSAYLGGVVSSSYVTSFQLSNNLANYAALSGALFTGAITVPSVNHGNNTVNVNINSTAIAINGGIGTNNQVLTSNGTATIWASVTGGSGSVNTASQYTFTNTITFSNTIVVSSVITANGSNGTANQVLTSNATGGVYWSTVTGGGSSFSNGASIAVSNIAFTNATGTSTGVAYQFINTISGSLDTVFS